MTAPVRDEPAVGQAAAGAERRARGWLRRRPGWELFLQFFAVLLGVSLATAVASWREERAAATTCARALRGLANEVAHNRSGLAERVSYYRSVVDSIDAARRAEGEAAGLDDVTAMRGMNPPFFRRAAYEVSFHSGAFGRFEFALAERIAGTYAQQEWMLAGVDKTSDFIVQRAADLRLDDLRMVFADWASMGEELLGAHDRLIAELPRPEAPSRTTSAP
ncbi:MAG: hypothetical protein F9K16_05400 [Thermoanaerobaculia bacterium]|nr:MAG: hypothetical protein F9K16_05400 [Thermoanaerobaculia bacterium]MBZ0100834.1 hypothetical protein [Thermoanaerobaculia bacterium]